MGRATDASFGGYRSGPPSGLTLCSRWTHEVIARLQALASKGGFAACSLLIAYRSQASLIFHNYPQAFAARFCGGEGIISDPVLAACRRQVKPVSWREYERTTFYKDAQELGLLDGVTVPSHGPGSLVVAVTLAGRPLVGNREAVELPKMLEGLGRETLQRLSLPQADRALASMALTERQALVLHLLADGLQQTEIAGQLGISVTAVRRLVERAMDTLGATNQTQAVAVAILEGKLGPRQV